MASKRIDPQERVAETIQYQIDRYGVTQEALADHIGVSRYSINQLLNGKRRITANMAIRLAAAFGVGAMLWMDLQRDADLAAERQKVRKRIMPLRPKS